MKRINIASLKLNEWIYSEIQNWSLIKKHGIKFFLFQQKQKGSARRNTYRAMEKTDEEFLKIAFAFEERMKSQAINGKSSWTTYDKRWDTTRTRDSIYLDLVGMCLVNTVGRI